MATDAANYNCPQCNGRLTNGDGDYTCEDCGLNVTEVLKQVEERGGPTSDLAKGLREAMSQ